MRKRGGKKRKHHQKYFLRAPAGFLRLQPTCQLLLGSGGVLTGREGVPPGPIAPTSFIEEQVGPGRTPRAPLETPRNLEATCDFLFFDPLEAEFEKVVFTKVVALAMFYLVLFEN